MAKFTKTELYEKIAERPLVPLFYHPDVDFCLQVLQACYNGGIRVFELTNRGKGADILFSKLIDYRNKNMPEMAIGIGTIFTANQAKHFIDLEADFVIQPIVDEGVAKVCNDHNIAWTPGAMTFTEIYKAQQLGSDIVKLFPGNIVGPDFLKAMKGPMPNTKILVTGGVEPNEQNIKTWFTSGAHALGLGSQLFTKEALNNKDFQLIENTVKRCFTYI
jgi:2-dehydro-3-deoxyphosphogluconate aldolase / (4S)-4-hydroxy-2-oxoglutarate aldolase